MFGTILLWVVIGGIAGWLASLVVGSSLGLLGDIVVGIVGAFIGGFITTAFGGAGFTGFNFWSLFVAFLGAVILLGILRLVRGGGRAVGSGL